jgi:ketosteroid isomerase-like protein
MPSDQLTNPTVKTAIEALDRGDKATWKALFTPDAKMFDDGNPRNLAQFSESAVGHERFTKIERVENNGCDVYGQFHSDQWGDFRTCFKFQLTTDNKIKRLDIGQAQRNV